jgi:hypothetical protein
MEIVPSEPHHAITRIGSKLTPSSHFPRLCTTAPLLLVAEESEAPDLRNRGLQGFTLIKCRLIREEKEGLGSVPGMLSLVTSITWMT